MNYNKILKLKKVLKWFTKTLIFFIKRKHNLVISLNSIHVNWVGLYIYIYIYVCVIIGFQLGKGRLALKQTSKAIYILEKIQTL